MTRGTFLEDLKIIKRHFSRIDNKTFKKNLIECGYGKIKPRATFDERPIVVSQGVRVCIINEKPIRRKKSVKSSKRHFKRIVSANARRL